MAQTKKINLALQGGGAHGAFTWGVLDRLLQEEEIEIAGISGTSAGALNGAALKSGMITGGRQGARAVGPKPLSTHRNLLIYVYMHVYVCSNFPWYP